MSKNENGLKFKMTYKEVINLSYEKGVLLTRDQTDLNSRGVTTARVAAFAGLRVSLFNVEDDDTMKAFISIAIQDRDAVASSAITAIREIIGIARTTFGEQDARFKTFKSCDLTALSATDLRDLCRVVAARGNDYLTLMQPKGLTAAMLTNLTAFENSLDLKIEAVEKAESNQLNTTQIRHTTANALFDEMRDLCNIAQVYWADRNPVKASEYIIYDEGGGFQQRNGLLTSNTTVYRELANINADTAFKIQVKDGNELVFYFSQFEEGSNNKKTVTVAVDPNNYSELKAADLGYDAATGFIKFCIKNTGSVESLYRVVVE